MKRNIDDGLAVMPPNRNVVRQSIDLLRKVRENRNGHRAKFVWLAGRPGAGNSTLANAAALALHATGIQTAILGGDNVRLGLCSDLGLSDDDRNENVRRVAETARLFIDSGIVVLVALVSPHREARENARILIGSEDFAKSIVNAICPSANNAIQRGTIRARSAAKLRLSLAYRPDMKPCYRLSYCFTLAQCQRSNVRPV